MFASLKHYVRRTLGLFDRRQSYQSSAASNTPGVMNVAPCVEFVKDLEFIYSTILFKEPSACDEETIHLMTQLIGTSVIEALYIIHNVKRALSLSGDVCEFGVAQGSTSALLAHTIDNTSKHLWLFDSFQGLPQPSEKDLLLNDFAGLGTMAAYEGAMACEMKQVQDRLASIGFPGERLNIVPGFFEEVVHRSHLPEKVCFAYLDFDLYEPTMSVLEFLDKRLQTNGVIIVDDYDFFSTGVKTAVDEFIAGHKSQYTFSLPIAREQDFCIIVKYA